VVLAVVVTLLAGCVGDDEEADPPGSTGGDPAETTVSSTTAAATTPEEEVEAAYMAFLAMLERVTTTSNDPSDPEIAELTVETPYDLAGGDGQWTDCSHVFQYDSSGEPGGRYSLSATIVWDIAWTASTGARGDLADASRQTSFDLSVTEMEAVVSYDE
jgi:hypothetical protein